jgi:signal transduction histidine kinase
MRGMLILSLALAAAAASAGWASDPAPVNPRFTGTPLMRVWRAQDYHAAEQNWRIAVAPGGLVYVANQDGVLEFDGEQWRLIPLPSQGAARALAIDARGRVWVGAHDDICRLEPDPQGRLHAVSLLGQLPAADRAVGTVSRAVATADTVYLRSRRRLIAFGLDGDIRSWPAPDMPGILWPQDGAVYVDLDPLSRVDARGTSPVPLGHTRDSRPDAFLRIFASQPSAPGGWRLLTSRGPVHWPGPGHAISPTPADTLALFADDLANTGVFLPDGRSAFGTDRSGLLVLSDRGELQQKIDRSHGLPSTRINDLATDGEGGLWLAFDHGVARLALDSPFALHGAAQGLTSSSRHLAALGDRLYVAHAEGVSRRAPHTGYFHRVDGFQVGANRLLAVEDRMLAGTRGLLEITPDDKSITWTHVFSGPLVAAQRAPGWLFVGSSLGLALVPPDVESGGWQQKPVYTSLTRNLDDLLDPGDGTLWAVDLNGVVLRADFSTNQPVTGGLRPDPPVRIFGPAEGLPHATQRDQVRLFTLDGELFAGGMGWLRRYDSTAGIFVPEPRLALPAAPAPTGLAAHGPGATGGAWVRFASHPGTLAHFIPGHHGWQTQLQSIAPLAGLRLEAIFEESAAHTLWLAASGALVSVDLDWQPAQPVPPLNVKVRRVETGARELLDAGAGHDGGPPERKLAWRHSALRFTYAAPAFGGDHLGQGRTLYRTRLEGFDSDWTPWTADTVREFTNLPYRRLIFQVQARALDGRESAAVAWPFAIAPPWWYAPWAFAGYVLIAGAVVAGYVRLRTRSLRARAARLEGIVAARTEDLRRNNLELARLHAIERDEKLAARLDEEKARLEMLRYQLNPHFLYNSLASIAGTALGNPPATRTMAQRLADFCRLTLTRVDGGETLREELRLLQSYLAIEQARWGESLQIGIEVADETLDRRVPTFLLLPLLENAIKHGGETTRGTLRLRLAVRGSPGGGLVIEVANSGRWDPAVRHPHSTGIGLENLRRRLARYFPDSHTFVIGQEGEWVVARLALAAPGASPHI